MLYEKNELYRSILDTGLFVYADGHIVHNSPEFGHDVNGLRKLTPWASEHADQCCLRFRYQYRVKIVGRYLPGRLNYDEAYVKQMEVHVGDLMKANKLSLEEAQLAYAASFPDTFKEAFEMLRKQHHTSLEAFAFDTGIPERTLYRILEDPENKVNHDFIMGAALLWKLPDFIAELLFDRVGLSLSMKIKRHVIFKHILRVEWEDGIEKANEHLKARGCEPLQPY